MLSAKFTADVWTAIVHHQTSLPGHAVLHVIAAILSLLLLTGMFRATPETEPDDRPETPAKQQHPGQETGTIESDA